jgi:uncharacterized protein (TIGR02996 family)
VTAKTSIVEAAKAAAGGDAHGAIGSLLVAWREVPAPAIAETLAKITKAALPDPAPSWDDALDDLSLEAARLLTRLRDGNAAEAAGRMTRLKVEHDPRVADAIVELLEDPPWHATGSKPFWMKLFALLDANVDPRTPARLAKIKYAKIINGESMRGWMTLKVKAALKTLAKKLPKAAALRLPADAKAALAKVKLAAGAAKNVAPAKAAEKSAKYGAPSERDLYRAVYENPDDDAPRAVLADFLMERGDPRGELISLQLAPPPQDHKRSLQLIRKNAKAWIGALAPFVKYVGYPNVLREDALGITMWWKRGFVAGCIVALSKPKVVQYAEDPFWSMLERTSGLKPMGDDAADRGMETIYGRLRSIRTMHGLTSEGLSLAARTETVAKRLERVEVGLTGEHAFHQALAELGELAKQKLTAATLTQWQDPPRVAKLLESRLHDKLTYTCLQTMYGNIALTKKGDGWSLFLENAAPGMLPFLELLKAERLVSVAVEANTPATGKQILAALPGVQVISAGTA